MISSSINNGYRLQGYAVGPYSCRTAWTLAAVEARRLPCSYLSIPAVKFSIDASCFNDTLFDPSADAAMLLNSTSSPGICDTAEFHTMSCVLFVKNVDLNARPR